MMLAHPTTNSAYSGKELDSHRAAMAERRAMWQWSAFILFLLGGSVSMWIYAAVLAVSDPSMAVVPDYHEKALQWDKQVALNAASQKLGWTVHVVMGPPTENRSVRVITLFVRDAKSQPLEGAVGSLRLYHHARAGQAETVDLTETSPGSYEAPVQAHRSGAWQLEVKLDRANDHFEWNATQNIEIPSN